MMIRSLWDKTSFSWNQEPPGLFSGLNGYKLPAGWRGLLQVEGGSLYLDGTIWEGLHMSWSIGQSQLAEPQGYGGVIDAVDKVGQGGELHRHGTRWAPRRSGGNWKGNRRITDGSLRQGEPHIGMSGNEWFFA